MLPQKIQVSVGPLYPEHDTDNSYDVGRDVVPGIRLFFGGQNVLGIRIDDGITFLLFLFEKVLDL